MTKKITLESLSNQIAKVSDQMAKGFAVVAEDIVELRQRIGELENGQEKILEALEPLSRAHDRDSETILDHGRRMARIEKHVGVK